MSEPIFMFPGQSSRYPEMIEKIVAARGPCRALVDRASVLLDRDLLAHYRAANAAVFATNRDVQVGVFLANHLHMMLLHGAGVRARMSLGLSLGEYNHLVHIGAIAFEDALRVVDQRGQLYDEASGGLMISVFPLEAELVEQAIVELGLTSQVAIGLYNSPRQNVISGAREAVERVIAALEVDHFFEATVIEPRIPMHAPVFRPLGERLRPILDGVAIAVPALPYVPNVLGTIHDRADADLVRRCLVSHTHQPVRWRASVDAVAARVPDACFVEVGPRAVLFNLFGRGWSPGTRAKTDAAENWPAYLSTVTEELRRAG